MLFHIAHTSAAYRVYFYILVDGAPFIKGYSDLPAFIAAIALLAALTALSWRLVEHPGIILGRQLRYRPGKFGVAAENA